MEIFFKLSCKFNALEVQEIIYRRYANADSITQMPWKEFVPFVELAFEKDTEDKLHRQWCAMLPYMSLNMLKYMSFDEYQNKLTGKDIDTRPASVIIAEIRKAHKEQFKKGD